jgi:hypothetical protein
VFEAIFKHGAIKGAGSDNEDEYNAETDDGEDEEEEPKSPPTPAALHERQ